MPPDIDESKLKRDSISATLWSDVDSFGRRGIQFFISILLARLLAPEDFGTIALLSIFVSVAGIFVDSDFASALIQIS